MITIINNIKFHRFPRPRGGKGLDSTRVILKRNILILLTLLVLQVAHCQTVSYDTVSVDEMKSSFYSSLKEKNMKSFENYDLFLWGKSLNVAGYVIPNRNSESLHNASNMLLPASLWKLVNKDGKINLCWIGFRSVPTKIDTVALRRKLIKEYGSYKYDDIECIPAKWYSGSIQRFKDQLNYKNSYVSKAIYNFQIENGTIARTYSNKINFGSLILEVSDIRDAIFFRSTKERDSLDDSYQERDSHYELFIFQHDINRLCQEDTTVKGEVPYSFLISVDGNKKAHIHTLLPTTLTPTDSLRIRELTKAVEAQPKGIFGTMWTIDGRVFPGRYLMAVYTRVGWRFKDYRYKERRPGLFFEGWKEPL